MARQSSHRPDADEPEANEPGELDEARDVGEADDATETPADRSLWENVGISPVEIALPTGAGLTLRAYRMSTDLTPTEVEERDEEDPFAARARDVIDEDDETVVILDEDFPAEEDLDEEEQPARDRATDDESPTDEEDEDEEDGEEVPVFLSHRGKLLLFKSPESLVAFVRSGAPNDLAQVDGWNELVERIQPADVVPLDEDSYELDLVVENLRGGHDTWDFDLLIEAGEAARDLGYALRLRPVLVALSAGSPLDDLDEALRSAAAGGVGGFMGRRRLRKIGAQQASLGWRTIIGKISAAVDWRD